MIRTGIYFLIFLVFNFGALAVGGFLMGESPATNEWYQTQNLAPWTPPGWVFGAAWTAIMLLFSIYMTILWKKYSSRSNALIYGIHLLLNIGWNPVFFQLHYVAAGLIILVSLFTIILINHSKNFGFKNTNGLFIIPYCSWLCIAFSLNLYVLLYN